MVPIPVVIPVAFADGYTGANGADAHAHTNFFSKRRGSERRHSRDNQSELHRGLSILLDWNGNTLLCLMVP
ncbi:MAG: hypothetical protein NVS4B4_04340 [Bradyrhizobium sp.]